MWSKNVNQKSGTVSADRKWTGGFIAAPGFFLVMQTSLQISQNLHRLIYLPRPARRRGLWRAPASHHTDILVLQIPMFVKSDCFTARSPGGCQQATLQSKSFPDFSPERHQNSSENSHLAHCLSHLEVKTPLVERHVQNSDSLAVTLWTRATR